MAQLERMVLLYLMTFCNITVLCLTKLVLNLLLLQLLSADDFFLFLKKNIVKGKNLNILMTGGRAWCCYCFNLMNSDFIISLNGITKVTQSIFLIQFLVL